MKKFLAMVLALAMCLSLAACGSSSSTESAAETAAAETAAAETAAAETAAAETGAAETTAAAPADAAGSSTLLTGTLNVGAIGPLTGAAALYGNAATNGESIAVDEINAMSADFQIEFNPQDDEHDAEKSVNAYNVLKDWGAQVIAGCVTTTPCVAVAAEAAADNMFMLTPSASSPKVTENNDNVYQVCFSDPNQGTASAQYIAENGLATKVAVIYNNSDAYSTGIYQTFVTAAEENGLEIVSTTTFTDDTANDFSVQLQDAQTNGAELIFLPIYYTPASLIMQQAANMGYEPLMFGVDGMDGILSLEGFDTSLAEGVMLLTPFSADATDDLTVNFVTKFNDQYGETPSQFAADGYDTVYAIYYALCYYAEQNGGLDVTDMSYSDLCDILEATFSDANFSCDGLTGTGMTWTSEGEVNKAPKAVVIENGAYVGMD